MVSVALVDVLLLYYCGVVAAIVWNCHIDCVVLDFMLLRKWHFAVVLFFAIKD